MFNAVLSYIPHTLFVVSGSLLITKPLAIIAVTGIQKTSKYLEYVRILSKHLLSMIKLLAIASETVFRSSFAFTYTSSIA